MAIGKKDAKRVVAVLRTHMSVGKLESVLGALDDLKIKNKSFRKSIGRMKKILDKSKLTRPKKAEVKEAA